MTKLEFLKHGLLEAIKGDLSNEGFSLNAKRIDFTRKKEFGWERFQLVFLNRGDSWEINPAMLVRYDRVEEIFHKSSGFDPKYQNGTPTIGISIEDYLKNKTGEYRLILKSESDLADVTKKCITLFNDVVTSFFSRYDSLKQIDAAVNENPEDTFLTGPIFKGSKGIILSKLTNRTDYDQLVQVYLNYYEKFANGFYLVSFQALIRVLGAL